MMIVWFAIYVVIYRDLYFSKHGCPDMLSGIPNSGSSTNLPLLNCPSPTQYSETINHRFGPLHVSWDEFLIQAPTPQPETEPRGGHGILLGSAQGTSPEHIL